MRVKNKELGYALMGGAPTRHWRGILDGAVSTIREGTIAQYDGVRIVDDKAWRDAMSRLRHLPAGGRHVAKSMWELNMWLRRAVDFSEVSHTSNEEGESK